VNSTIKPNWIGEFAFGLHYQRANVLPLSALQTVPLVTDLFAVVNSAGNVITPTDTTSRLSAASNFIAFVDGRGGSLQRNFVRQGFGLFSAQDRNRVEFSAKLQNIWGKHTLKYGFEYGKNIYKINTVSTGSATTFADPNNATGGSGDNQMIGFRATNNFGVCTFTSASTITCPASALTSRVQQLITDGRAPAGVTTAATNAALTSAQLSTNPFLVLSSVRVRDFRLQAPSTNTNMQAFYIQEDFKLTKNLQINGGLRWDYQQAYGSDNFSYLKLNNFKDNMAPRIGFIWDFTGKGKGKIFANYAKYIETPLPLDVNVRAGSDTTQTDKNINVSTLNSPGSSYVVADIGNLGSTHTPIDPGLKPQDVKEWTAGVEYEIYKDITVGFRGIYRNQGHVIEDGSFDDGNNYFLFNPGRRGNGETTEDQACLGDAAAGRAPQCFGFARRYYRALEFTATKRFTNNYQFIASYVFSSLIGNYEGLFRNDNGQSDPNITSLFDLQSLLAGTYGRLPNDRPHQFKFDGSYRTPWKLLLGASFRAQSGIPFNALIPHPVYGNNEGFCNASLGICHPRGTAIVPTVTASQPGFPNKVDSIGSNRTPTTFNLDMNAYYPIKFGEKKELRFEATWFNVFNNQRAIRLDETLQINSGIPGAGAIQFANPFYGAGTIFQFPSSFKFGAKFSF
jgi:outer membrane receptor protein involved in Fe transport